MEPVYLVSYQIDLLLFVLATFLSLFIAVKLYKSKVEIQSGGDILLGLVSVEVVYCASSVVFILVSNAELLVVISVFRDIIGVLVAMLWVMFTGIYSGKKYAVNTYLKVFALYFCLHLSIYVLIPLFIGELSYTIYTEPYSFAEVRALGQDILPVLANLFSAIGVYWLLSFTLDSEWSSAKPVFLISFGAIPPTIFGLEFAINETGGLPINYTPVGLAIFFVFLYIALSKRAVSANPLSKDTILTSISDAVIAADKRERISDFNQKAAELFGITKDNIGENVEEHTGVSPESIVSGEESEESVIEKEYDDRVFNVSIDVISRNENTYGWVIVFNEITRLKETEKELRRSNERMDKFTKAVGHDLRNPIHVAESYAGIIQNQSEDISPEDIESYSEKIRNANSRMEEIVSGLMELARNTNKELDLNPVDMEPAVQKTWDTIETNEATVEVDDMTVVADETYLQTIFENLFTNAIEHGPDDVTITVEKSGPSSFAIEDTGPGIELDDSESIFEFGESGKSDGTGIGLAIVKELTEMHGWNVSLDTEIGEGARFVFTDVEVQD